MKAFIQMHKYHKRCLLAFVGVAVICVGGCKPKSEIASTPPSVEVATVTRNDVPIYHEWIATLDGLLNAQIRAQVAGYLLAQDYHEGDLVKKGDLLFEIDPRPFRAAQDHAKGMLTQAEARFGKTQLDVKRCGPLVITTLERELVFPFGHGPRVCLGISVIDQLTTKEINRVCIHRIY